jgi:hypothetical protein
MLVGGKRSLLITPLPFSFLSGWIRSDNIPTISGACRVGFYFLPFPSLKFPGKLRVTSAEQSYVDSLAKQRRSA